MSSLSPSEGAPKSFEPKIAETEFEAVEETISHIINRSKALIEKVSASDNPDLKKQGWHSSWKPNTEPGSYWEGLTDVRLDAAYGPPHGYREKFYARGPKGEALYINAFIDSAGGRPAIIHQLEGTSDQGEFRFHYGRGGVKGYESPQASVGCTMSNAEYDVFFRAGTKNEVVLRITPVPLGHLEFSWGEDIAPDIEEGGKIRINKDRLMVSFADWPAGRSHLEVTTFNEALDWYKSLDIENKDAEALARWFEELPEEINLRVMLQQAEEQAGQAIETLTKLSDDLSSGWQMTQDVYIREKFHKYHPVFLDEKRNSPSMRQQADQEETPEEARSKKEQKPSRLGRSALRKLGIIR